MAIDVERAALLIDALSASAQQTPRAHWLHDDAAPGAQSFIAAFNACVSTLANRGTELCEHAATLAQDSRRSLEEILEADRTLGRQLEALDDDAHDAG